METVYEGKPTAVAITIRSEPGGKLLGRRFVFGAHKVLITKQNVLRALNNYAGGDVELPSAKWERVVIYDALMNRSKCNHINEDK